MVLSGWVLGPGFGFVLGGVSMFASALLTGGVGPWMPFQMPAMGWFAMGAGLLPGADRLRGRGELALLFVYDFFAAFAYGTLTNLAGWPFMGGNASNIAFAPDGSVPASLAASSSTSRGRFPAEPGCVAGSGRALLLPDVLLDDGQGRAAAGGGEVGAGPEASAPQVAVHMGFEFLAQAAGGDALEGVHQFRQGDLGRIVHEEMYVVVLAVELAQLGLEVDADLPHDLLTPVQHCLGEYSATVFGHENQVDVEVVDHVATGSDIFVRLPSG